MKYHLVSLLSFFLLVGCVTKPPYGNYTKLSKDSSEQLANDAALKVAKMVPATNSHIVIKQNTGDDFGKNLTNKLRQKGYALESDSSSVITQTQTEQPPPSPADGPNTSLKPADVKQTQLQSPDANVGYIVSDIGSGLYSVTLTVNAKQLSRVYQENNGKVSPTGSWALKE